MLENERTHVAGWSKKTHSEKKRKVSVLVIILYFNEVEEMVDLNLKDFPGSQESTCVILLSVGFFLWPKPHGALQGNEQFPMLPCP